MHEKLKESEGLESKKKKLGRGCWSREVGLEEDTRWRFFSLPRDTSTQGHFIQEDVKCGVTSARRVDLLGQRRAEDREKCR